MEERTRSDEATNGNPAEDLVEEWRNAAYNCFSSGHKFCREVCPVMQVTRDERHTPTAFHANVVAMDKGPPRRSRTWPRITCIAPMCGACELRCPNTLFTGDFYRLPPSGGRLWSRRCARSTVKEGRPPGRIGSGRAELTRPLGGERARSRLEHRDLCGQGAGLGDRPRHSHRGRDGPLRGLRSRLLPAVGAACRRAHSPGRGHRVRPHEPSSGAAAGRCGRPATSTSRTRWPSTTCSTGGRPGTRRSSASTRTTTSRSSRTTRHSERRDFDEFEIVLGVDLIARADSRRQARADRSDRAHRHLPRPVPAEQADGRVEIAAGDPAGDPRPDVRRRRPRHAVVLLLRRRLRTWGRRSRS